MPTQTPAETTTTAPPLSEITAAYAADRITLFADERRLKQKVWHERSGHDLACLLGSIHDDIDDASKCPAQVMPQWCAELIVELFDGIPAENIFDTSKRFADALRGSASFTVLQWDGVRRKFLTACVTQALESARKVEGNLDEAGKAAWEQVQKPCGDVLLLLSRDDVTDAERASAARSAASAASSAASSAAWSAASAASAAWSAASAAYQSLFDALISSINGAAQ